MYLFETGLGEVFKPRPQAPAPKPPPKRPQIQGKVVKDGHWRYCSAPSGGLVSCDLNLKVRFRRSFAEFLRAVEAAYGRWMEKPTAQKLVKKLQADLKKWHDDMLYHKLLDNDPMNFVVGLNYRRSNGTWLVADSSLRQWHRLIDI